LSRNEKIKFLRRAFKKIRPTPDNVNVEVSCPNKKCKSHNSSKLKLVIQLETQQYNCWVCGISGLGVRKLAFRYFPSLADESSRVFKRMNNSDNQVSVNLDEVPEVELPKGFVLLVESKESIDPDIKASIKYSQSRGMSDDDLWYFKLCATPFGRLRHRVIMPSFDSDGCLNYYVARSVFKDSRMKYINSRVPRRDIIFNEINIDWSKELTLVEGPFDLVKANNNATCLLGCSLKEDQNLFRMIVKNDTPVCLALDPDMRTKMYKIASLLNSYGIAVRILDCNGYDDVGEMTKKVFFERLNSAKKFGNDDRLLNLISSIKSGSLI